MKILPTEYHEPKLRLPLRQLTVGFDPRVGVVMVDGKASSPRGAGYFERMFLFGKSESDQPERRFERFQNDLADGQGTRDYNGYTGMPGIRLKVNGRTSNGGRFSRDVVEACSKAHVDVAVWEQVQRLLQRAVEVQRPDEALGDAMVSLQVVLSRFLHTPLVGYTLSPVVHFSRDDDFKVEGVPLGMQLYLTGVIEGEDAR